MGLFQMREIMNLTGTISFRRSLPFSPAAEIDRATQPFVEAAS